jgi:hypothetical protein
MYHAISYVLLSFVDLYIEQHSNANPLKYLKNHVIEENEKAGHDRDVHHFLRCWAPDESLRT